MIFATRTARTIGLLCLSLLLTYGASAESTCGIVRVPGGSPHRAGPPQSTVELVPASSSGRPDYRRVHPKQDVSGMQEFWLAQYSLASAADVESAEAVLDCDEPAVLLTFDRDATTRLANWSAANRGGLLAVLVDGNPSIVASVKGTLGGKMALRLSSGKLARPRRW